MPERDVTPRKELRQSIREWEDLVEQVKRVKNDLDLLAPPPRRVPDPGNFDEYEELHERFENLVRQREAFRDRVIDIVGDKPGLKDEAIELGFKASLLEGPYEGSTDPDRKTDDAVDEIVGDQGDDPTQGRGGGGGGNPPNLRGQAADNRLFGDKGKDYVIRRGPEGGYHAVYSFTIDGKTQRYSVQIHRNELGRYGIKEGEGKLLSKAQMRRIENIGWADELAPHVRQGDSHMVEALERYLRNQYGGNPMLRDKEVMGKVIANSFFGWSPGEFENQLRQTKWYQNTNEWQRTWDSTLSDKERKQTEATTRQQVINALENNYGFDYLNHIEGGMEQVRKWVDQIASGRWGTPNEGLAFWSEKQFDRASGIEGTPAWMSRQKQEEADRAYLNRPENKSEALRQDMLARFGRVILGKKERDAWAADIVSETRSDADWDVLMRKQMKNLYPYFDENLTFTEQASPYKAMIEETLGSPVEWDHKLLTDFSKLDDSGKPTGTAMSLYDYQLLIRDPNKNPEAYQKGTNLYDQGMDDLGDFLRRMKGAA